jgi:F-type H+-transporting ATPase subunit b
VVLAWPLVARSAEEPGASSAESVAGEEFPASTHTADDGSHADEHGGHGNANPLSVDPDLAIFTAIIFILLLLILWKFAWGPISEALEQRERGIEEQIAAAKQSREESDRMLSEHRAKLDGAAEEVRGLIEQARREADAQKQQIVADAQQAAAAERDRAVREIGAAKNQALSELAQRSVDTAVGLAGRIVRRQLSSDDHTELINDALGKFSSEN